eukprot:TRINITY_DN114338_c0_g1_i1.p1 TRINITY_DN114338_c0_g1~~TRINITY_DN114338_c0_g1_i1.p1  ORF type:complete len:532 (+),score=137.03 TRINITY_DN114338_c0_g1_i1:155-1750(+)
MAAEQHSEREKDGGGQVSVPEGILKEWTIDLPNGTANEEVVIDDDALPAAEALASMLSSQSYRQSKVSGVFESAEAMEKARFAKLAALLQEDEDCELPFFTGCWAGTRNNFTGEVGLSFMPTTHLVLTALGRHCSGTALREAARVTLWATDSEEEVAHVEVGPTSEVRGGYAFEPLEEAILLRVGVEYRLTLRCKEDMLDPWFDGTLSQEEAAAGTENRYGDFKGGVMHNAKGYPRRFDGDNRRAGIVNFKFRRQSLDVLAVDGEELAHVMGRVAGHEKDNRKAMDLYMTVKATVLSVLVEQLATWAPATCAFVIVAPEEILLRQLRFEDLGDYLPGDADNAVSVFDSRFSKLLMQLSRRCVARMDALGSPCEGCVAVDGHTGKIVARDVRVFPQGDSTERPLGAARCATLLQRGVMFTRSSAGCITVYPAYAVCHGHALRLRMPEEDQEEADEALDMAPRESTSGASASLLSPVAAAADAGVDPNAIRATSTMSDSFLEKPLSHPLQQGGGEQGSADKGAEDGNQQCLVM